MSGGVVARRIEIISYGRKDGCSHASSFLPRSMTVADSPQGKASQRVDQESNSRYSIR